MLQHQRELNRALAHQQFVKAAREPSASRSVVKLMAFKRVLRHLLQLTVAYSGPRPRVEAHPK